MTKLIKPKNRIKKKVGDGGFKKSDIEKAQKSIDENKVDFRPIAKMLSEELGDVITSVQSGGNRVENILNKLLDPLMQLEAQGSLFHYPSITLMTDVVVDFLDTVARVNNDIFEIIKAYKKMLDAIVEQEIKDAKNPVCQAFIKELEAACLRYLNKHDL